MVALINKIDPNKHPRLYLSILIAQKWIIPITISVCWAIVVILACMMMVDGLNMIDQDTLTDNEKGLFNVSISVGFLALLSIVRSMKK